VLPIGEKFLDYASEVAENLKISDIRALVDDRNEKIGKKIRDAELNKIPFMLIIGEKEMETEQVAVRRQGIGDLGTMPISALKELIGKECEKAIHKQ
jgi:threonyl-tRNA synthetase